MALITYVLDCRQLTDKASAHRHLKAVFGFPEYYGNNLDALHDCLGELGHCRIYLDESSLADGDSYAASVLEVLTDSAEENPRMELKLC